MNEHQRNGVIARHEGDALDEYLEGRCVARCQSCDDVVEDDEEYCDDCKRNEAEYKLEGDR